MRLHQCGQSGCVSWQPGALPESGRMGTDVEPYKVERPLTEELDSITAARLIAGDALDAWHYPGSYEDVLLVVSELVTNALLHGSGAPVLSMSAGRGTLRIEVGDDSERLPLARRPGPRDGWGLHVIGMLCTRWGVSPRPRGKVVWCEIAFHDEV
jgi:hypothetical protein